MQHFKKEFKNPNYFNTFSNIQRCLRLNDIDEIGDSTHLLSFDMIGLFSFREWTLKETIDFFMKFLERLNLRPDYVTLHPDKIKEWSYLYQDYNILIKEDTDCLWTDGDIGGYSTEFYINNIEVGNIVNTLGTCIDVGFGLERLIQVSNNSEIKYNRLQILESTSMEIINNGISIGDFKESYILKKLIVMSIKEGSGLDHPLFQDQRKKMIMNYDNYKRTKAKPKFKNKDSKYWKNTFGIDEDNLIFYEKLKKID